MKRGNSWVPTLRYPPECKDPAVPKAAREELKARIRKAHQEVCVAGLQAHYEEVLNGK